VPLRYAIALLVTNQYEAALTYLASIDQYRTDAVHIALALPIDADMKAAIVQPYLLDGGGLFTPIQLGSAHE
jgi:hypothetical protein